MLQTNCSNFLSRFVLIAGLLFCGFAGLRAQNPAALTTVSPYSRFGLGDFQANGGQINTALGGGGIGYRNDSLLPQYINLQNPASLTSHQIIAYEVSLQSSFVKVQSATAQSTFNRTTLGNVAFAFPVTKWWGSSFGLVPYSAVGYNISTQDAPENIGPVTYKYEGSGGINQLFFSNGFRPFAGAPRHFVLSSKYDQMRLANDTSAIKRKLRSRNALANISVGVNASWLFGTLSNVRRDIFPDSMYTFNTKITKRTVVRDVYLSYGIQYSFRLQKALNPLYVSLPDSAVLDKSWLKGRFIYRNKTDIDTASLWVRRPGIRVSMGATFSLPTEINVAYDLLAQTYKQVGTIEQFRDTAFSNNEIPGRITIPAMGGFGIMLKKDYKWIFQADYMTQLWSQHTYLGVNPGLKNSQRITAGFQLQPKQAGRGKYLGVTQYRLGVRWYQTNLELHNSRLTEMSANFGLALPVPFHTRLGEPVSRLNINFEYGVRGTTSNNLLREDYMRITVGFTINDRWFNRPKYD
jgi:hypothetical protein